MSAEPDHLPRRLWWVLAGLTLAWGFNWTAMKVALSEVPPWTFRSLCLGLGAAVLFAALRASGQRLPLPRGQWGRLWLLALLNITSWNMLVAFGVGMIPSGRAAILAYTMPGFATSSRTKNQAWQLMRAIGATAEEMPFGDDEFDTALAQVGTEET